jgi:suppressor of ftsI/bilirubin oxidase
MGGMGMGMGGMGGGMGRGMRMKGPALGESISVAKFHISGKVSESP